MTSLSFFISSVSGIAIGAIILGSTVEQVTYAVASYSFIWVSYKLGYTLGRKGF